MQFTLPTVGSRGNVIAIEEHTNSGYTNCMLITCHQLIKAMLPAVHKAEQVVILFLISERKKEIGMQLSSNLSYKNLHYLVPILTVIRFEITVI